MLLRGCFESYSFPERHLWGGRWPSRHVHCPRPSTLKPKILLPEVTDMRTCVSSLDGITMAAKPRTCAASWRLGENILLIEAGFNPPKWGSGLFLARGRLKSQAFSTAVQESCAVHNWPGARCIFFFFFQPSSEASGMGHCQKQGTGASGLLNQSKTCIPEKYC